MRLRGALACAVFVLELGCSDKKVTLDLFPVGVCVDSGCTNPTTGPSAGSATVGSTGSSTGAGGAPSGCGPLADRVQIGYPTLPAPAVASDEYHPMVLAPKSDDTSLLAYKESGASRLRVVSLSRSGNVEREVFQTQGEEAHALLAHDDGGALVFKRDDPDIYSEEYCSGPNDPNQQQCGSMDLVRFDDASNVQWQTTLTEKTNVAVEDALFMYYYEHTARIVWAENTYGVYFRSARNGPEFVGRDLYPTDTLRFVDGGGSLLEDRGWRFGGCTFSWSVRLAYDNGVWAAACHGDSMPDAHRVAVIDQSGQREVTFLDNTAPNMRALGGLVPRGDGFWLSYLARGDDALQLHLARVTPTPSLVDDHIIQEARYLDSDYVFRTYMAKYGDDLLLGWKSNQQLVLAVADFETGQVVDGPVVTESPIDNFVEFVSYPGGDVGWAHSTSSGEVTVTRVLACTE